MTMLGFGDAGSPNALTLATGTALEPVIWCFAELPAKGPDDVASGRRFRVGEREDSRRDLAWGGGD